MKTKFLLFILSFALVGMVSSQNTKSTSSNTKKDVQPRVYKVVNPDDYETSIVNGKLILYKRLEKDPKTSIYATSYSIGSSIEKSTLSQKHVGLVLTNQFFETTFLSASPEIAEKSAILKKYVTDKNISLTDEKGWSILVKYYNDL